MADTQAPQATPTASALADVEDFLGRFVCFPSWHARLAATLWVAHTYVIDAFDTTPRLAFLSPEPGSGKTRALEVISSMVRRPMHAVNASPAALFRAVGDPDNRPTVLFDEIDTIFGPRAKDNEELRGFLNAGHRRSGVAYRCESTGTSHRVIALPAFAAVAIAGLHDVPDTVASRAIIVRMRRRGTDEPVAPYRLRLHEPHGLHLGERLAAALDGLPLPLDPALPPGVNDRAADVWEPLLSIAQAAGGNWSARAAEACVHFVHGDQGSRELSLNLLLLTDLRRVFDAADNPDALPTSALLGALHAMEESPWKDLRGKPLDPARLARRLRSYEISSHNQRLGTSVVKAYRRADLNDAWTRYLPALDDPDTSATAPSPADAATSATPATPQPSRGGFVLGRDRVHRPEV